MQEETKDAQEEEEPVPTLKVTQKKIFMTITELIGALQSDYPDMALKLNLQAV